MILIIVHHFIWVFRYKNVNVTLKRILMITETDYFRNTKSFTTDIMKRSEDNRNIQS